MTPDSEIARHVVKHGDGVKDVALRVADVDAAFRETTARGARGVEVPRTLQGSKGTARKASIAIYGDTVHSFIDRSAYAGVWLPRFRRVSDLPAATPAGLAAIDHIVGNVPLGGMNEWARFYRYVMGFQQLVHFTDAQVS